MLHLIVSSSPMVMVAFYMLMSLDSGSKLLPALASAINPKLFYLAVSSTLLLEGIINISNVAYTKARISFF